MGNTNIFRGPGARHNCSLFYVIRPVQDLQTNQMTDGASWVEVEYVKMRGSLWSKLWKRQNNQLNQTALTFDQR